MGKQWNSDIKAVPGTNYSSTIGQRSNRHLHAAKKSETAQLQAAAKYILIPEVLTPIDPGCQSGKFKEAIAREIVGLLNKKAFKVVIREELSEDANILRVAFCSPSRTSVLTKYSNPDI